jgi:hypothetical protein
MLHIPECLLVYLKKFSILPWHSSAAATTEICTAVIPELLVIWN